MISESIERKAKLYVYDLNNCATENGFKQDETWEFSMATNEDKVAIEKKYFPTLSAKVQPELLLELFNTVKANLANAVYNGAGADPQNVTESSLQYLIAYNPARLRR